MSNKTKYKIQRALGLELPGLGKEGALNKRNYPPGQHGRNKRGKPSEFALQLREKQKLMFHYGLREEQLRRFVRQARTAGAGNWIESLLCLLERRLDNVVFRLGFARSIAAARQLVSHGHVLLNGRCVNIGSVVLRVGDFVRLTEYAAGAMTESARSNPRLLLPSYLQFALPENNTHGRLLFLPGFGTRALSAERKPGRGILRAEGCVAMSCEAQDNLLLAELASLGSVSVCACGTIHVSVGAVTLRLSPEAFGQMVSMCRKASDQMLIQAAMAADVARLAN